MRLWASTAILSLTLAMAPIGLDLSLDAVKIGPAQALAKSGSGSDGDDGSDNSGPGGGGDDHDNSGPGSGGDDHDNSGPGSANSGRGHGGHANDGGGGGDAQGFVRSEITLDLPSDDLNDVMAGRKLLIDDLGRVLEVEIELEHGFRTVIAKPHGGDSRRNPGPITSFTLVDAGGAMTTPGNDDGTPDQGPGDN